MTGTGERPTDPGVATPGTLIVTFAGLYLRKLGCWIAVADLISLLAEAGQSPTAVRQALVRLKSRGFLAAESRAKRAGYSLTEAGLEDLASGDSRIFRFGEASESDGWVLAVFSVPEQARAERHRLRTLLSWMGFGTVSPGVWIAPAELASRSRATIETEGLGGYVTWFTARSVDRADVAGWWDLGALRSLYARFLDRWRAFGESTNSATGRERAFANYLLLVDDWRQFPRIDPGLPSGLLPGDWPGKRAFERFSRLRDVWSGPAEGFVIDHVGRTSG